MARMKDLDLLIKENAEQVDEMIKAFAEEAGLTEKEWIEEILAPCFNEDGSLKGPMFSIEEAFEGLGKKDSEREDQK